MLDRCALCVRISCDRPSRHLLSCSPLSLTTCWEVSQFPKWFLRCLRKLTALNSSVLKPLRQRRLGTYLSQWYSLLLNNQGPSILIPDQCIENQCNQLDVCEQRSSPDHALCAFGGGNPLLGSLSVTVHFVRGDVQFLPTLPSKQSMRRDDSAPAGRFHYLKSLSLQFRTQSTDAVITVIKLCDRLF